MSAASRDGVDNIVTSGFVARDAHPSARSPFTLSCARARHVHRNDAHCIGAATDAHTRRVERAAITQVSAHARHVVAMRAQRDETRPETISKKNVARALLLGPHGTPYGIRTRVTRMRTWRPGPLDERGKSQAELGGEESNPQLQDQNLSCCRLHHPRMGARATLVEPPIRPPQRRPQCSQSGYELLDLAMTIEAAVAEDPAGARRGRSRSANRRHSPAPLIGLVRVGDVAAFRPTSCAMSSMRAEWYGSETSTTLREVSLLQETRRRGERLPRRPARRLAQDRGFGHAVIVEIARADARLGEAVAGLLAAGHDDRRARCRGGTGRSRGRGAPRGSSTAGRRTARRRAR